MGYTAREAGMVLAPGGLVVLVLMPLVGTLITRIPIRWLLVFGVLANVAALELMARLSLGAAFDNLVICRVVQGMGLAFMFVPINTAAFANMPREQISSASGIINLARNIGGSVGISLSVAYVKQVSQMQQVFLSAHVTTLNVVYNTAVSQLRSTVMAAGAAPAKALTMAQAIIYRDVLTQSGILAYIHAFRLLGLIFLLLLPLMLLIKDVHKRPPQPVLE
jgi:DHA2 family multidrug resistance protein